MTYKKGGQWIKINDKSEYEPSQEEIYLRLQQGNQKETDANYEALILKENKPIKFKNKIKEEVKKRRTSKNHKNKHNAMEL